MHKILEEARRQGTVWAFVAVAVISMALNFFGYGSSVPLSLKGVGGVIVTLVAGLLAGMALEVLDKGKDKPANIFRTGFVVASGVLIIQLLAPVLLPIANMINSIF